MLIASILQPIYPQVNEYPWMTGLGVKGSLSPMCGAALVSDQFLLTAAHCCSGQVSSELVCIQCVEQLQFLISFFSPLLTAVLGRFPVNWCTRKQGYRHISQAQTQNREPVLPMILLITERCQISSKLSWVIMTGWRTRKLQVFAEQFRRSI